MTMLNFGVLKDILKGRESIDEKSINISMHIVPRKMKDVGG